MKPLISVVVPAFNEEKYLPKCLEALERQDFRGTREVIVVNNNSRDNTESIARSFKTKVVREKQQGLIFSKQAGCKHAKGKYIVVLDADNIPAPHWLKTIIEILRRSKVAAVTGPYLIPKAPWWARLHTSLGIYLIQSVQFITKSSPHIWGGNVAFRREHFEKFGGYDTRFTFAADEVKLRKDLKKFGRIHHSLKLAVTTSTRRFKQGFFYFYFNFILKEYILNYLMTAYLNKKLPHPKNIREEY
jgi:glycosyltransferase involved in cell wall biosynthesis